jgi:transposase
MSLQPQELPPVPDETRRIARAAFPKGNVYIRMRDSPRQNILYSRAH